MRNSSSGHAGVIEWLLISLAPKSQRHLVTARDRDGETALHIALSREGRPVPTSTDVGITSETCPVILQLYDKARNEGVREPHAMALAAFLIVKGNLFLEVQNVYINTRIRWSRQPNLVSRTTSRRLVW